MVKAQEGVGHQPSWRNREAFLAEEVLEVRSSAGDMSAGTGSEETLPHRELSTTPDPQVQAARRHCSTRS